MQTRIGKSAKNTNGLGLPNDVILLGNALLSNPEDPLYEVAKKLITNNPRELITMWVTLEKRKHLLDPDCEWVWGFLEAVKNASRLPKYQYKSKSERQTLAKDVSDITTKLARILKANDLDHHLIHVGMGINGYFCYFEDCSDSHQAGLVAKNINKVPISALLDELSRRSNELILAEPIRGKKGVNVEAVRFARKMIERNLYCYQKPLNAVVATATNAIFGTNYSESDISNIHKR